MSSVKWWPFCLGLNVIKHGYFFPNASINFQLMLTATSPECHGISNHQQLFSLFNSLFRSITKQNQSFTLLAFFEGNPQVTGEFSSQRNSNVESDSLSWHLHEGQTATNTHGTLRPRQNGRRFPDDILKFDFLEWKYVNFD